MTFQLLYLKKYKLLFCTPVQSVQLFTYSTGQGVVCVCSNSAFNLKSFYVYCLFYALHIAIRWLENCCLKSMNTNISNDLTSLRHVQSWLGAMKTKPTYVGKVLVFTIHIRLKNMFLNIFILPFSSILIGSNKFDLNSHYTEFSCVEYLWNIYHIPS